ncbi:MAG TPA: hypothetical protein VES60_13130, partial [Nakamurella sp.]|nr:hypothetical protein [Nakamurella sp.]
AAGAAAEFAVLAAEATVGSITEVATTIDTPTAAATMRPVRILIIIYLSSSGWRPRRLGCNGTSVAPSIESDV